MKYSVGRVATLQDTRITRRLMMRWQTVSLDWGDLYAKDEYAEQLKKYKQISLKPVQRQFTIYSDFDS